MIHHDAGFPLNQRAAAEESPWHTTVSGDRRVPVVFPDILWAFLGIETG